MSDSTIVLHNLAFAIDETEKGIKKLEEYIDQQLQFLAQRKRSLAKLQKAERDLNIAVLNEEWGDE